VLWRDVAFAWRMLAKSPLLTGVAILSLALGIGANTAIFSLVNALMLRALPVPEPQELVSIGMTGPDRSADNRSLSLEMFKAIRREQTVFTGVFAWMGGGITNMEANGVWYEGSMNNVSGEYFATLGVKPLLGRLFGSQDVRLEQGWAEKVAVLDYRCWSQRFGRDPGVIGKTMHIDANPVTIIGVTPPEFTGLYIDGQTELTAPMGYSGRLAGRNQRNFWFEQAIGRLKPGVTIEQARAQMEALWPRFLADTIPPALNAQQRNKFLQGKPVLERADRGFSFQRDRLRVPLRVLMALVGVLLLVACVNLANLMLARAAARQHEFGVRLSLGASRWQIARQLLVESLLLSLAGAGLGVLMATYAARFLERMLWRALVPIALNTDPDLRVLLFTLSLTVITGALFGLAPVWALPRPAAALGQNSRTVRGGSRRITRLLVSAQLSLSLVLLIGAALLVRSITNLQTFNPGFNRSGILTVLLTGKPGLRDPEISSQVAYYRELAKRLSSIPGVKSVSYSSMGPGASGEYKTGIAFPSGLTANVLAGVVSPGFLDEIGMRIVEGRDFTWGDDEHSPRVGIVSQSFARKFFPKGFIVGQRITLDPDGDKRDFSVVGVVSDASLWSLKTSRPLAVFEPVPQNPDYGLNADLRFTGDSRAIEPLVRRAVDAMGRQYPIWIESLEEHENRFLKEDRVMALISGFLGGMAALLSAVGIYGVLSQAVARRTGEIGVRMAVGANRVNVVWLVMREVAIVSGIGLTVGVLAALASAKLIASMLYDLAPNDPPMILTAVGILAAVALTAGYLPARRAALIDPMRALRNG
jgi:predicted permease